MDFTLEEFSKVLNRVVREKELLKEISAVAPTSTFPSYNNEKKASDLLDTYEFVLSFPIDNIDGHIAYMIFGLINIEEELKELHQNLIAKQ